MGAGLKRQAHFEIAGALVGLGCVDFGVDQFDAMAVEAHVELRRGQAGGGIAAHANQDGIFGVEGGVVLEENLATFVDRQEVEENRLAESSRGNFSTALLALRVPTARRLMRRAELTYFSMCMGETVSTSPMLSKP